MAIGALKAVFRVLVIRREKDADLSRRGNRRPPPPKKEPKKEDGKVDIEV